MAVAAAGCHDTLLYASFVVLHFRYICWMIEKKWTYGLNCDIFLCFLKSGGIKQLIIP